MSGQLKSSLSGARKDGAVLVNIAVRHYRVTVLLTLAEPCTIDIVRCDSNKDEQQGPQSASSRSSNILTAITTTTTSLLRHNRSSLVNGSLPVVSRWGFFLYHLLTLHFFFVCVCVLFFQYGSQWERR